MSKAHIAILIILEFFLACAHAGVYPNYHANFDFATWSKDDEQVKVFKTKIDALNPLDTLSIYQIYPRSFQDSDGDGVGDLNGITSRLEFLKQLGIGAVWISPIFKSPMADFGYDIANYTEIDPIFGTMADFERLLARGRDLGIAILLDFVPNHTSDESEWFKLSAARDPTYKDFYVWHPGKMDAAGERHPPTNWRSVFRGSAWTWHEGRGEYYLHQFLAKQPDLNYRNPSVREAMQNVLRFWLEKGVGGFRIDAVPFAFEIAADEHGNWPDEPRNDWVNDPDDYGYLKHIYTVDQPETLNLVYEWRSVLKSFDNSTGGLQRLLLTEAYSPLDVVMQYYGNGTAEGSQVPFNFLLIGNLKNESNANNYADTLNDWLSHMPAGRAANWVLGNHDQNRVGSRLGTDRIDMLNMLILTLPGVSVTYQGEELGMTDVWISWNDTVDPSACNSNPDIYEKFSRDPERTPYQWSAEQNAGFSNATKTWLPIAGDYKEVNWASEVVSSSSVDHLRVFMNVMSLRKEPTYKLGQTEVKALSNSVLAVKRSLLNAPTYITLLNIYDGTETVDLKQLSDDLPEQLEYVVITDRSQAKVGELANTNALHLLPKEAVVLRTATKLTTSYGYYTYYTSGTIMVAHFGTHLIILWQIILNYLR